MAAQPQPEQPRPLVMDVDTGIDDMIALMIAATSPELNLRGVTCVAGNVEIHHVARNTGKILRMLGRGDVPVSIGAARPLQRRLRTAPDTHGPTGTGYVELRGEDRQLGTTEYTAIPASRYLGALPDTHLAGIVRDAVRFYVGFHQQADGIDGAYLHDPVALIGSLLRPELVTERVTETLACDTSSDAYLAGSLFR